MKWDLYQYTHPGGRIYNEDRCMVVQQPDRPLLLLLADGLGGHGNGDRAAQVAVDCLSKVWREGDPPYADAAARLTVGIARANEKLVEIQQAEHLSLKTTLVAASPAEEGLVYANCGDSRLYLIQGGAIRQVTRDHSVTWKKFQAGQISRRQINEDEDRTSLLRAVGDSDRCVPDVEFLPMNFAPGDGLLLCSDGFWEYLHQEEILADCLKSDTAAQWAQWMLLRVMERIRPDTDNLTLLAGLFV